MDIFNVFEREKETERDGGTKGKQIKVWSEMTEESAF